MKFAISLLLELAVLAFPLSGILVMAARIDGIAGTAVNQTGLSQKNGGVTSQVRLKRNGSLTNHMVRLPTCEANLLMGCDAVVAANDMVLNLYE